MKNYSQWTKTSLTATLLTFSFGFSSISFAGIDVSCTSSTQLQFNSYDACNNLPALTPTNDNRTNMLLLLSDLGLAKLNFDLNKKETLYYTNYSIVPFEAISLIENAANQSPNARLNKKINLENDQEHCNSLKAGQDEFVQQVKADKRVSPTEQTILIRARTQLNACKNDMGFIHVEPNWSIQTRQYASYLNGTIAFYNANFSTASHIYSALTQVEQAWIKETAQYMLIRCQLNLAHQSGVAEYGDLDRSKINPKTVVALFDSITAYFKAYPNDPYAASARGFLRRGFTFNNRQDLLINELVWQINNPKSKVYNLELNNLPYEIDRQIFQSESFNVQNLKDPFF